MLLRENVYEVSIWFRTLTNVSDAMIIGYVPDGFEPQERITHVVSSASPYNYGHINIFDDGSINFLWQ